MSKVDRRLGRTMLNVATFGCMNLTSSKGLLDPPPEFTSHSDVATADQLLFRCCLLFYVGVKDRVPFAILHLPDRPGVVDP